MDESKNQSGKKELYGCLGLIGAAFITGIFGVIVALPTLMPLFRPSPTPDLPTIAIATSTLFVNSVVVTENSTVISTEVTCIHPDQLATQYGWKDSRIIDKFYGGYNVYVSNPSQLPPLWEANYFGMDNVFSSQIRRNDSNRQMDIGTWIIYAPDECRTTWGFAMSSTPAPSISSPSEIPNTVLCIHPEQLISQKGWENLGVLDNLDGGYKARISVADTLPDYWEANRLDDNGNLLRQIFYFDQDRRMDIGVWSIYTPPIKSCRDQFGFTIGGK